MANHCVGDNVRISCLYLEGIGEGGERREEFCEKNYQSGL